MEETLSPEIAALRDKWLYMEVETVAEEEPTPDGKLLTSQQVNCPNCKTIVEVPFGTTKVSCHKCGTAFELKKRLS